MGRVGSPVAHDDLAGLLDDDDPRLAEVAAESLVQIGPRGRATLEERRDQPAAGTALVLAGLRTAQR